MELSSGGSRRNLVGGASYLTTTTRDIEAVLCDLDDTLYPQATWLDGAWRAVAAEAARHGIDEPAFLAALQADSALGSARGGIIDRALAAVGFGTAAGHAGAVTEPGSSVAAEIGAAAGHDSAALASASRAAAGTEAAAGHNGTAAGAGAAVRIAALGTHDSAALASAFGAATGTEATAGHNSAAAASGAATDALDPAPSASGCATSTAACADVVSPLLNPTPSQPATTPADTSASAPTLAAAVAVASTSTSTSTSTRALVPVSASASAPAAGTGTAATITPTPADLIARLVAVFRAHRPVRLEPYPGVREALARLRMAGVRLAVVTDGDVDVQAWKVRALGLSAFFECVVVSDALGGRAVRKPHAAPFLAALEGLGVRPGRCVVVGDRPEKDVTGAVGVDIRAIRVKTGEYQRAADVAGTWHTAADFPAAVDWLLQT
ncbi:HAD superfamily hydrolase (TIGR01509 family) [Catenulispora sp. EB89]|uniref:HAD family hydrolase n=1 Tax=Catenulispora sp. EB89 TaxID=3156257 RepID=UPI003519A911